MERCSTVREGIQFAVLENGAVVWDWKKQSAIEQEPLPKGVVKSIFEDIEEQVSSGYYAEVIVNGKVYADVKIQKELEHSKIAVSGHFETAMYCHR